MITMITQSIMIHDKHAASKWRQLVFGDFRPKQAANDKMVHTFLS